MVYYYQSRSGCTTVEDGGDGATSYLIYMGKDKFENEELIQYGWPEDVWFHVDDLSSAHVYLRMKPGMTLDDIPEDLLVECATLVKANSIAGCKQAKTWVVYTRWKNLKKTSDMVPGQVGFHRPENKRRIQVEKNQPLVRQLEKTRTETKCDVNDLYNQQQGRLRKIQQQKKAHFKQLQKEKQKSQQEAANEKELRSYDRLFVDNKDKMKSNTDVQATADSTAAEEFEDDFF